jgi:hypothetical protein
MENPKGFGMLLPSPGLEDKRDSTQHRVKRNLLAVLAEFVKVRELEALYVPGQVACHVKEGKQYLAYACQLCN